MVLLGRQRTHHRHALRPHPRPRRRNARVLGCPEQDRGVEESFAIDFRVERAPRIIIVDRARRNGRRVRHRPTGTVDNGQVVQPVRGREVVHIPIHGIVEDRELAGVHERAAIARLEQLRVGRLLHPHLGRRGARVRHGPGIAALRPRTVRGKVVRDRRAVDLGPTAGLVRRRYGVVQIDGTHRAARLPHNRRARAQGKEIARARRIQQPESTHDVERGRLIADIRALRQVMLNRDDRLRREVRHQPLHAEDVVPRIEHHIAAVRDQVRDVVRRQRIVHAEVVLHLSTAVPRNRVRIADRQKLANHRRRQRNRGLVHHPEGRRCVGMEPIRHADADVVRDRIGRYRPVVGRRGPRRDQLFRSAVGGEVQAVAAGAILDAHPRDQVGLVRDRIDVGRRRPCHLDAVHAERGGLRTDQGERARDRPHPRIRRGRARHLDRPGASVGPIHRRRERPDRLRVVRGAPVRRVEQIHKGTGLRVAPADGLRAAHVPARRRGRVQHAQTLQGKHLRERLVTHIRRLRQRAVDDNAQARIGGWPQASRYVPREGGRARIEVGRDYVRVGSGGAAGEGEVHVGRGVRRDTGNGPGDLVHPRRPHRGIDRAVKGDPAQGERFRQTEVRIVDRPRLHAQPRHRRGPAEGLHNPVELVHHPVHKDVRRRVDRAVEVERDPIPGVVDRGDSVDVARTGNHEPNLVGGADRELADRIGVHHADARHREGQIANVKDVRVGRRRIRGNSRQCIQRGIGRRERVVVVGQQRVPRHQQPVDATVIRKLDRAFEADCILFPQDVARLALVPVVRRERAIRPRHPQTRDLEVVRGHAEQIVRTGFIFHPYPHRFRREWNDRPVVVVRRPEPVDVRVVGHDRRELRAAVGGVQDRHEIAGAAGNPGDRLGRVLQPDLRLGQVGMAQRADQLHGRDRERQRETLRPRVAVRQQADARRVRWRIGRRPVVGIQPRHIRRRGIDQVPVPAGHRLDLDADVRPHACGLPLQIEHGIFLHALSGNRGHHHATGQHKWVIRAIRVARRLLDRTNVGGLGDQRRIGHRRHPCVGVEGGGTDGRRRQPHLFTRKGARSRNLQVGRARLE